MITQTVLFNFLAFKLKKKLIFNIFCINFFPNLKKQKNPEYQMSIQQGDYFIWGVAVPRYTLKASSRTEQKPMEYNSCRRPQPTLHLNPLPLIDFPNLDRIYFGARNKWKQKVLKNQKMNCYYFTTTSPHRRSSLIQFDVFGIVKNIGDKSLVKMW